jgi:hypothetical protein
VHPPQGAHRALVIGQEFYLLNGAAVDDSALIEALLGRFGKDKLISQAGEGYFAEQGLLRPADALFVVR